LQSTEFLFSIRRRVFHEKVSNLRVVECHGRRRRSLLAGLVRARVPVAARARFHTERFASLPAAARAQHGSEFPVSLHRRKVLLATAAVFAFGLAFAAQPTAFSSDRADPAAYRPAHWTPGTDMPMSAFERNSSLQPMPH
jgi:hypothetical protein